MEIIFFFINQEKSEEMVNSSFPPRFLLADIYFSLFFIILVPSFPSNAQLMLIKLNWVKRNRDSAGLSEKKKLILFSPPFSK